jgi:hypothetical protein
LLICSATKEFISVAMNFIIRQTLEHLGAAQVREAAADVTNAGD